ncbi:MAG: hypothetical protein LW878_03885 [Proteobacteria bacterium]|nr:hypothetical protein [Pseudomonadota bacterium]
MKFIVLIALVFASLQGYSQIETRSMSLRGTEHVPLYDCSILENHYDRRDCQDLSRRAHNSSWERHGYAVNCYDVNRRDEGLCLSLARRITHSPYAFNCSHLPRRSIQFDRCLITRDAYDRGYFEESFPRTTTTTTTTTRVIENRPVVNTCDYDYYDRSYQNWIDRKEEQRRRGQTRTAIGVVTTIGGLILGGSDDRTTRTIGQAMQIGGVFLTAWGLVEVADANFPPPHRFSGCSNAWRGESRRVVVEQQTCTSTRYTEVGRHTSRSYYEVNCSNRTYVTYEKFDPWYRGY